MEAWPIVWRLFPAAWFLAEAACAQSSITIPVDTRAAGVAIPADFLERNGEHLFGPGKKALIARFRRLGGDGNLMSGATARDTMLSRAWIESYDRLYNWFAVTALSHGLPYGRKKTNNFTGGAKDAPDTFTRSYGRWTTFIGGLSMAPQTITPRPRRASRSAANPYTMVPGMANGHRSMQANPEKARWRCLVVRRPSLDYL